jgi:hypothetical protein
MSVEQHTLSGIPPLVNTFYVSLLVPVGAVGNTGFILEQTLPPNLVLTLSWSKHCHENPVHSDGVGATATAHSACHSDRSRSDSDGGVEEPAFCRRHAACAMPLAFEPKGI